MKRFFALTFASLSGGIAIAQQHEWAIDNSHSKIGFSISHFGISETEGRFTDYSGKVITSKPDFSDASISFNIHINSINTGDEKRDMHLKSPDFFDTEKFAEMLFIGKKLSPSEPNHYKLTGDLSMHGVTKEITLDVVYRGTVTDPYKNEKAGFRITGELDRTDWGLKWNGLLAAGGLLVGNTVNLDCNIELIRK